MRAPFLLLPVALTMLSSMPVVAQDAPRVIFCTGQCFAVDQNGIRTPAPKGTTLGEGQRLETGPGAYAQLKLGPDAALGVGERAQVRFDQRSVRNRDLVILDQGRIRMVGAEAIGKVATRNLELRTADGVFDVRGDMEIRKPPVTADSGSSLTFVKLNAGDARLLNPEGAIAITKDSAQGFTAGRVVTDRPISVADVALTPTRVGVAATAPAAPVSSPVRDLPVLAVPAPAPTLLGPASTLTLMPLSPVIASPTIVPVAPVISAADKVLLTPVADPGTGTPTTITKVVTGIAPTSTISGGTTASSPLAGKQLILAPATNTAPTPSPTPIKTINTSPIINLTTTFCRFPC